MRGKRLLAFLLCLATIFQLVPSALAEDHLPNETEEADFSVYTPSEIDIIASPDGTITTSPKDPAVYNGIETKPVAVTGVQIAVKEGWTLVPFSKDFSGDDASRMIGVNLNGEDIDPSGLLDLSDKPWVIEANGKLPLALSVNLPGSLPREDMPGVLTIRYTFDWAEQDNTHTLTPVDGDHGTAADKTPVKTDKHGMVQDNLPDVTPEDGYEFDKWVDEGGNEVKPGDILDRDITISPTFNVVTPTFTVEYDNGLMLPESNNTATFKWDNAPENFELAEVTSSDPSVADVGEIFDSASESQQVEVKALKRGAAKFTGISTTGEKADFDVLVSELSGDERPTASVGNSEEIKPGDVIAPEDIKVTLPTVTPDGDMDSVTVTPTDVTGNEIEEGKNVVSATVDANGVNITINIIINIINQVMPTDPEDHTHTITINPDGGGGRADSSEPLKTDKDGKVPDLPSVTPNEGYVPDKWVDETGSEVKPGDTIDDDITIMPTFKPDENYKVYTITINPDGDHGHADSSDSLKTDRDGKVPALPSVTPDAGCAFDRWVDEGGKGVSPGDILDRDVTITPIFQQDNTHILTPVDGDHGTVDDKTPIKTDVNGVVQDNLPNVTPSSGYKVEKWVDESGKEVKPGDTLTKDVTITPIFSITGIDNTHTLTPTDGNHGTVPDKKPIQTDAHGVVQDNFPKTVPDNGYGLKKWLDENGNEIMAGDRIDKDLTITPVFEKVYTVGFCVENYVTGGGSMPEIKTPYEFEVRIDDGKTLQFDVGYPCLSYSAEFEDVSDDMKVKGNGDLTFTLALGCEQPVGEKYGYFYRINILGDGSRIIDHMQTNDPSVCFDEYTYTIKAEKINPGECICVRIGMGVSHVNDSETYTLYFDNDGDHGKLVQKCVRQTSKYGIVLDNFPEVVPDPGYELDKWIISSFLSYFDKKVTCRLDVKPGDYVGDADLYDGRQGKRKLTITPIYKQIEQTNLHILTPIDGEHGIVPDKTPVQTDKRGVVQNNLPNVTPNSGYGFEKWIDVDSGKEVMPGVRLTEDVTIKPVFKVDNAHTLTPVDGDHGTVNDKTPIKTDVNGVVQNNFPKVTCEDGYKVDMWVYVDSGEKVNPGDMLTEDVYIKPVIVVDNGPYTIYFQTASYYALSDTTPLTTIEGRKVPMDQMPEVSPIVSHFFDGVWVNIDTNEVVNAETKLSSDITVKPQINCLFTEKNGAVTGFSDYAQDKNVESITIPCNIMGKSVSRIADNAFCFYINPQYNSSTGITHYDENPKACEIKHVVIEEGIKELGTQSFGSMNIFESHNLESVLLPDGLKIIGKEAFYECSKLTSITIPDTVTTIGDAAFFGCSGLASVNLGRDIRTLGYRAFFHCTALRSIALPSSLRTIDGACFEGSGLETVNVPDGCSVGNSTFIFCDNLTTATLGEGTSKLYCTFQRCPNLKRVYLPRSVTTINVNAFYYCPNLAYIYIKGSRDRVSGAPWDSSNTNPTVIWTS